jgi:hypothetical protein
MSQMWGRFPARRFFRERGERTRLLPGHYRRLRRALDSLVVTAGDLLKLLDELETPSRERMESFRTPETDRATAPDLQGNSRFEREGERRRVD